MSKWSIENFVTTLSSFDLFWLLGVLVFQLVCCGQSDQNSHVPFRAPSSVCCAASYHSYSVSVLFFYTCCGNAYSGECKEMSKQHKKYCVVFKYGAPHKLRTLIPDNAVAVFHNHISSCSFQSPSFLMGAVRVSSKESVLYCCSCFPFTQISPDQNAQSCLIMLLNKQ